MVTRNELAAAMNGREYGVEITQDEARTAKASGLVAFFGASDDLLEARGAIHDEWGAYESTAIDFTKTLWAIELVDECDNLVAAGWTPPRSFFCVKVEWYPDDRPNLSWRISSKSPHSTFEIMEDGEAFCVGIVIDVGEIRADAIDRECR
jgi:hypothetical protein